MGTTGLNLLARAYPCLNRVLDAAAPKEQDNLKEAKEA
jgi:hypothetical protein